MFRLPFAAQPDIVLSNEKDQLHTRELRDQVYMVAEGALGPQTTSGAKPELNLLADLFYFVLTTAKGRQTLGEEYCDLYLVETDAQNRLLQWKRWVLALLITSGVYVQSRLAMGGWSSLWSALRRETARERAAALARRNQQQRLMTSSQQEATGYLEKILSQFSFGYLSSLVLAALPILARAHLAAFYWQGDYFDAFKRVLGARYAFTREPSSQRPTYRVLSVFIALQLGMQLASYISERISDNDRESVATAVVVPSMSADDVEAQTERNQALFTNVCGICLSPLKAPACPPCGHVYCYECIVESCVAKSECPLCRQEASPQSVQCIYV